MIDYVGKQLGNYRLARLLGDGGFAQVYLGEHIYLANKSVAIKVLKGSFTEEHIERFRTEAQTIHNLQHPHLVQVMDFGVTTINGQIIPFLVMDYAPHGSLAKIRPSGGVLPLTTVLFYLKPLVSALQYAHDQHVIHRDIKPANLLIGKDGQVLLSDFGIAVTAHATSSMTVQDVSGTPAYMAPEQFDGKSRPASDQYALGIILYEWLCGEQPFSGPSFALYALQHKTVPPTSLIRMGAAISPSIEKIILKALEKDPKQRFTRVQDFADAFEQAYHTYEKEMTTWLDQPKYTLKMLQSEDAQYVFIQRCRASAAWWTKEAYARFQILRQEEETHSNSTLVTVMAAIAEKARNEVLMAVKQENTVVFETMLNIMLFCANPSSRYPTLWTTLIHDLASEKAHIFVIRQKSLYAQLVTQWITLSPALDKALLRSWLPLTWLEFGAIFALHVPDTWNSMALPPLLETPIPPDALLLIVQSNAAEDFLRSLLASQKQATAVRWFIRLVESGYQGRMSLVHALFTANLRKQEFQQIADFLFLSAHFAPSQRVKVLETYGKQFLLQTPPPPIIIDQLRQYMQTFEIGNLEQSSPAKAFLLSLHEVIHQLPPDLQPILKSWQGIATFIEQPNTQRGTLNGLADMLSILPSEVYPKLMNSLAKAFVSCLKDEFDLMNIVGSMSPILADELLNVLLVMAKEVGKAPPQKHSDTALLPYIRFVLTLDKMYEITSAKHQRFVRVFLDTLLQNTNDKTLKKISTHAQNWPPSTLNMWRDYVSRYRRVTRPPSQSVTSKEKKGEQKVGTTPTSKGSTRHNGMAKLAAIILLLSIVALSISPIVNTIQTGNANATATAVQEDNATATTTYINNTFSVPQNWKVALNDPLSNNTKGYQWKEGPDGSGDSCQFTKGTYQATEQSKSYFYQCTAGTPSFSNFALQVQMKLDQGDCEGIIFRGDVPNNSFYYFDFCQNGDYALYAFKNDKNGDLLDNGNFSGITIGQWNTLEILANQNVIKTYINRILLSNVHDSTFTSGRVALTADDRAATQTVIVYRNIEVWTP